MLTLALRIARKDFGPKLKKEIYVSNSIHRKSVNKDFCFISTNKDRGGGVAKKNHDGINKARERGWGQRPKTLLFSIIIRLK